MQELVFCCSCTFDRCLYSVCIVFEKYTCTVDYERYTRITRRTHYGCHGRTTSSTHYITHEAQSTPRIRSEEYTLGRTYTRQSTNPTEHTSDRAHTRQSTHPAEHTPDRAHTRQSTYPAEHTPGRAHTRQSTK